MQRRELLHQIATVGELRTIAIAGNVAPDFAAAMESAIEDGLIILTGGDVDGATEAYMLTNAGRRAIGLRECGNFRSFLIKLGILREQPSTA